MNPGLVLVVLLAGAAMAVVRFLVSTRASSRARSSVKTGFPLAVLIVNAVGSLVAGLAAGGAAAGLLSPDAETVLLVGIAAGLTTFSTFNVETLQLLVARRYGTALASVTVNYAIGLAFAAAGYFAFPLAG
jgi:CrcB protein